VSCSHEPAKASRQGSIEKRIIPTAKANKYLFIFRFPRFFGRFFLQRLHPFSVRPHVIILAPQPAVKIQVLIDIQPFSGGDYFQVLQVTRREGFGGGAQEKE
jgi:hypothetical protein